MKRLITSTIFFILLVACVAVSKMNITQGIGGRVTSATGNQMPAPGQQKPAAQGISTTVYIYQLTNVKQTIRKNQSPFYTTITTQQVMQVQSDNDGVFKAEVPPGDYSIFVKVNNMYYANRFDEENNIAPVKVVKGQVSISDMVINNEASY